MVNTRAMPSLVTQGPPVLVVSLFAVGFTVLSLALGRRISRMLRLGSQATLLERVAIAVTLGAGALQLVPFGLGVLGQLSVSSVRVTTVLLVLALLPDVRALLLRAVAVWRAPRQSWPGWLKLWLLALLPGLLLALLSALTPTIDPDGLGYHLTVPKRWLALGSVGYLPTYPYSNTPMCVEMLFTLGLSWVGDAGAKVIHLLLGVGAALGLFAAGKRLAGDALAALAVTLLLFGPFGIAQLMGCAYVEGVTSCALIASGLSWIIWYQHRDLGYLRAAGLLAGIGVSSKLTAALFPVALALLTLLLVWREAAAQRRAPLAASARALAWLLPFVVLPALPWLLRSALVTGNPVFPMFAGILPSRDFTAEQSKAFDQYNRYMVWGVGAGAAWDIGKRKLILVGAAALLGLSGGVLAFRQKTPAARVVAWVVLGTMLVQLTAAGLYKRYWIPLLAVVELPLLLPLAGWLVKDAARIGVVAVSGLLSLLGAKQIAGSANGDVVGLAKTSLGLQSQQKFLEEQLPLYPLYTKLNSEAPAQAGVILAEYCGGFYIDRTTFCADVVQSSLRLTTFPQFASDLQRLGVTHVIMPLEWLEPLPPSGEPPKIGVGNTSYLVRPDERRLVGALAKEHGRLLAQASNQGLFAIDARTPN
jgi:Dolichyl-phosphate-mannose-protein mannosyltransferase